MEKTDPKLVEEIEAELRRRLRLAEAVRNEGMARVRPLRRNSTKADTRKLAQGINALAEKLSLVPAQIAKGDRLAATRRGRA